MCCEQLSCLPLRLWAVVLWAIVLWATVLWATVLWATVMESTLMSTSNQVDKQRWDNVARPVSAGNPVLNTQRRRGDVETTFVCENFKATQFKGGNLARSIAFKKQE